MPARIHRAFIQYKESMADTRNREFDVIVWGASGFTGRLVAEYLASAYAGPDLRWAAAGRSKEKVSAVLGERIGKHEEIPVLSADIADSASLEKLAASATVILSTVGPYALYGSELVAACARLGTHYCDLAGEVQWMRRMIDEHQATATGSGARIVHACGFDSIPSDIGVYLLQNRARRDFGEPCTRVKLLVKAMKGGASGGTIASMLNAVTQAREDRNVARVLGHPYSLNPDGERNGPDGGDQSGIRYDQDFGVWTGPFVMASVNTRIVRRTNALLDYAYGNDFRYAESSITGRGPAGWLKSAVMTSGLGAFMMASSFDFTRRHIVERFVPKPGEGPNAEERENGFFNLKIHGATRSGQELRMTVTGDRDPGYGSTSKMLAESAVCLALDELDVAGGFWTPAAAMGETLARRLTENAGLEFRFEQA